MGKYVGLDKDEGWIKRRFLKIEKQMREDRAAKRLQASSIGKGGVIIKDGGSLSVNGPSGAQTAYLGPLVNDGTGFFFGTLDENANLIFFVETIPAAIDPPSGSSHLFAQAIVNLTSTTGVSQIVVDDTMVSLSSSTGGVRIAHTTTGSAANAVLDPVTGQLQRSTSSLRYKRDVEVAEVDPAAVLAMQPRTWRDKAEVEKDAETETRYVGFIAEELHELGLGQFVVYDTDGDPEAIAYDRLSVALLAVLKDQAKRLAALESERHDAKERD